MLAGYAQAAPLAATGPWGVAAWLVIGTGVLVVSVVAMDKVAERVREEATVKPQAIPKAGAATETQTCPNKQHYSVRIHAQGTDCGGTSRSTIGAPAINQNTPVSVMQALTLSGATILLLNKTQRYNRINEILKAEAYIQKGPSVGGYLGKKSFENPKMKGGIRYDVDCLGDGNSLVY